MRRNILLGVTAFLAACLYSSATGKTIYVDDSAPGPVHDGSGWVNAYNYPADALATAIPDDQILVAGGTYYPDEGGSHTTGDRTATFELVNGVAMWGGYAGYGQAEPNARDFEMYETILSGDLDDNDVSVGEPCDLQTETTRQENSYHVVTGSGRDATAVLDGFTITGGNANGPEPDCFGGGMLNYEQGNPTITNCRFIGNSAGGDGGGMFNRYSGATVTGCAFSGNSAGRNGGGMYNGYFSNAEIKNCIFSGNSADDGGGIYNYENSDANITNCTFIRNSADYYGGGIRNYASRPTVTNCTFTRNMAVGGGGMRNYKSSPIVTNCTFSGNAAFHGGGMYSKDNSNPNIINCTFSGNAASYGGGIYNCDGSEPNITNCILWGNSNAGVYSESAQIYGGTPNLNYCCVQGLTSGLGGKGNIGEDPLFKDADGPDDVPGTEDDNLRLRVNSPCIDAGDSTAVPADITDLDGNGDTTERTSLEADGKSRFVDALPVGGAGVAEPPIYREIVDMGAYEHLRVIIVDDDAPAGGDGSSWTNAYRFLQDALYDPYLIPGSEVWVAAGTYEPDEGGDQMSGDRSATFGLINRVVIYGGYAGYGEPDPEARDPNIYETILSGDLAGDDEPVGEPCDLLTEPTRGENSYHVVTASGRDATAVLDGFTIMAGNANGSEPDDRGGGMYNFTGDTKVTNCKFNGNSAQDGGGMYNCYNSGPEIANCTFSGNSAGDYGGGMYNFSKSNANIISCAFGGNSAGYYGGGMYNRISSPTVTNCIFSGNSAYDGGGGMYNFYNSDPNIINCTFNRNWAIDGGGIRNYGSKPTVINCILWCNKASDGNEIALHNRSTIDVSYCDVQGGQMEIYNDGTCSVTWGSNIDINPLFADAYGPDNIAGTKDDNLRLSPDSPCIDVGDNNAVPADTTDLDGHNRIIDGDCNNTEIVDIGVYEFGWGYIGDFDGECDVDFFDYSLFASAWLTEQQADDQFDAAIDIRMPSDIYIHWRNLALFVDNWLAGI